MQVPKKDDKNQLFNKLSTMLPVNKYRLLPEILALPVHKMANSLK